MIADSAEEAKKKDMSKMAEAQVIEMRMKQDAKPMQVYCDASMTTVSSILFVQEKMFHQGKETIVYRGGASDYHEWEHRTRLRMRNKRGKAYTDEVFRVVEELQGDAFTTALVLGLEELWKRPTDKGKEEDGKYIPEKTFTSGIDKLIAAIRAMVFPDSTHGFDTIARCQVP